MPDRKPVVHRLLLLLLVTVVGGVALAGLALPAVGGIGLVAKGESNHFLSLPSVLAEPALPQHSVLLDDQGHTLATLSGTEDRINVSIDQIPLVMQHAIVAIEDSRFYTHHGVDIRGTARALVNNGSGGETQGGSTLTQQYVKNVLEHSPDPKVRAGATKETAARKLQEARYALQLERTYSKQQILEKYLNIANFGNGKYGVGTASKYYFNESVDKLTLPQAALLAGIVNSPSGYNPFQHPKAATDRRLEVLTAMRKQGYITAAEESAAASDALPSQPPAVNVDPCVNSEAPVFCTWVVRDVLLNDPKLGATAADREDRLFNGGLVIKTTLDMTTQKATQAAANKVIPPNKRIVAMVAAVQPGTGAVMALAADRPYGLATKASPYANTTPYPTRAYLQPGSTFKAFTLATALKQGLPLTTIIYAPNLYHSQKLANPADGEYHNAADGEGGLFNMVKATWDSVNTYFVQLEEKVGVLNAKATAISMGLPAATLASVDAGSGSFTLGAVQSEKTTPQTNGESALTMAEAYATLAAHGISCPPHFATSAVDQSGTKITLTQGTCHRALSVAVADTETEILEGVLQSGTGAGRGLSDRVAAGKTGTTDNQAAAWFVGFTPQLSMAVGMGDPLNPSEPMGCVVGVCPVFGGTLPAEIWQQAMTTALADKPVLDMPYSGEVVSIGNTASLPDVRGLTLAQAQAVLARVGLNVVALAKPVPFKAPKGTIVAVSLGSAPAGRGGIAGGGTVGATTVVVTLSAGQPKPPTPSAAPSSAAAPPASGTPAGPIETAPVAPAATSAP